MRGISGTASLLIFTKNAAARCLDWRLYAHAAADGRIAAFSESTRADTQNQRSANHRCSNHRWRRNVRNHERNRHLSVPRLSHRIFASSRRGTKLSADWGLALDFGGNRFPYMAIVAKCFPYITRRVFLQLFCHVARTCSLFLSMPSSP